MEQKQKLMSQDMLEQGQIIKQEKKVEDDKLSLYIYIYIYICMFASTIAVIIWSSVEVFWK